jgi:hypothetical protein
MSPPGNPSHHASRVGIGIGIGIGIENSRRRTGLDPDTPRQRRAFPIHGPRPGGATDLLPVRPPTFRRFPRARPRPLPPLRLCVSHICCGMKSHAKPRRTRRHEDEISPDTFVSPLPARNSFSRRGWITLHHGFPGCARRHCSNARPRLRSRETRWRPSIDCCRQWSSGQPNSSGPFEMEFCFECDGGLLWPLYGVLWQTTSDPPRTPSRPTCAPGCALRLSVARTWACGKPIGSWRLVIADGCKH